MVDKKLLVYAGIHPTQAAAFADPLRAAMCLFAIDTPVRAAAFIAQMAHESADFTQLQENLFYSNPDRIRAVFPSRVPDLATAAKLARNPEALANTVYAGRIGNGDVASGDGWRFRGRGLVQLTGRANYFDAERGLNRPYSTNPDLVSQPADACLTAAWFWHNHKLNVLADASHIDAITRVVNGPKMMGAADRRQRFEQALKAFREV